VQRQLIVIVHSGSLFAFAIRISNRRYSTHLSRTKSDWFPSLVMYSVTYHNCDITVCACCWLRQSNRM